MLKIWGRTNSINVQKVMWAVAELGLAHQRTDAGLHFGAVNETWYRAMNRWAGRQVTSGPGCRSTRGTPSTSRRKADGNPAG